MELRAIFSSTVHAKFFDPAPKYAICQKQEFIFAVIQEDRMSKDRRKYVPSTV